MTDPTITAADRQAVNEKAWESISWNMGRISIAYHEAALHFAAQLREAQEDSRHAQHEGNLMARKADCLEAQLRESQAALVEAGSLILCWPEVNAEDEARILRAALAREDARKEK